MMKAKNEDKKPKKTNEKADELTAQARTLEIMRQMIKGARRYDILQYVSEERWNISERMTDIYIAKAKEKIKTMAKDKLDIEEEFGLAVFQLSDLYQKAVKANEFNVARMIRRDLSSLTGIDKFEIKIVATGDMAKEEIISELKKMGIIQKEGGNVGGGKN